MIETHLRELLLRREIARAEPYSVGDVARVSGLNYDTVNNFRNGKTTRFDADVLDGLCRALDVQPGDLISFVPEQQEIGEPVGV